jgi:transcriptional regulator GlxA family with amidase domain
VIQKKVGIIAFDNAEVLDVMGPYEVFSVAGRISAPSEFQVDLISDSEEKSVTLRHGVKIHTDRNISEAEGYDLLIVAGGITTSAEQNKNLLEFLIKSKALGATIASICTGAFILAEAGILQKNRVTTHWEDQKDLQERFPELSVIPDRRWVESEGVFTSGGISAGIDLSLHLVQLLSNRELALRSAKQMEYLWNQSTVGGEGFEPPTSSV